MAFGSYPREMMEIFWGWWGDFGGLRKEQDYLMQIRRDPTNPGIQLTLANLYFERKLYQQALEWYGRGAETAAKAAQRGMKVDKILIVDTIGKIKGISNPPDSQTFKPVLEKLEQILTQNNTQ